jgi:hypothetical protein
MVQVHWIDVIFEHAYLGCEPCTLGFEGEICCYNLMLNLQEIFFISVVVSNIGDTGGDLNVNL